MPRLRKLLHEANEEMEQFSAKLELKSERYTKAEHKLASFKNDAADDSELRETRLEFQVAIEELSQAQQAYVERMNYWVEKICSLGVILRDLRSGLLDFPARKDKFEYFLCWKLSDDELDYWHLPRDGFIGRRPLAVLDEYF